MPRVGWHNEGLEYINSICSAVICMVLQVLGEDAESLLSPEANVSMDSATKYGS